MTKALIELLPALQQLDELLQQAIAAAEDSYGPDAAVDHFRGLYINRQQAEQLLAQPVGRPLHKTSAGPNGQDSSAGQQHNQQAGVMPETETGENESGPFDFISRLFRSDHETAVDEIPSPTQAKPPASPASPVPPQSATTLTMPSAAAGERLIWLKEVYGLSDFDLDIILVALAPELDLRYERLYAYLQDDVSRRRPSVDLALNALCPTASEKLARRIHFNPQAPLIHHRLITLSLDRDQEYGPLLAHNMQLDGQIVRFLIGHQTLDGRLASFCSLIRPLETTATLPMPVELTASLAEWIKAARKEDRPLRLYLEGPRGNGRRRLAEALADEASTYLLIADAGQALALDHSFAWAATLIFREAWLQNAMLLIEGVDILLDDAHHEARRRLLGALAAHPGIVFMSGTRPWQPPTQAVVAVVTVPVPLLNFVQRRDIWQQTLALLNVTMTPDSLSPIANRFQLTQTQIENAAITAIQQAQWRCANVSGSDPTPTLDELFAAARSQTGYDLAALTQKVESVYQWKDIVLPDDTRAQLREMIQRVEGRQYVLDDWGFGRKLSRGRGINALFVGPSGTGKTMAAEILAGELGLDLYKIDLSGVVSKYIGETEKNLDRIFRAAQGANAILFFDEADALFGKRSEVRDSHDRYANIEISYLLQKMEEHDGVTILATNLRQNLDDAFVRRLTFTVPFLFPSAYGRRQIWEGVWPAQTPLAADVDLEFLAQTFKLSGGNIRNAALAAAFLAAAADSPVQMEHVFGAIRREYQKMGKTLTEAELQGFRDQLPAEAMIVV